MPLLQGQPFKLIKPPETIDPVVTLYTIHHTGEQFTSFSHYEDRQALYSQNIWSCQCTGKGNLSHQDAWTSEAKVRLLLQTSVSEPFRGPILCLVQHSTAPLEQLVEAASTACYTLFHPGEELDYRPPDEPKAKPMKVKVLSSKTIIISEKLSTSPANCSQPLSPDKSNNNFIEAGHSTATPEVAVANPIKVLLNGSLHCKPSTNGTDVNGVTHVDGGAVHGTAPRSPNKNRASLKPLQDKVYDVLLLDGMDRVLREVPVTCLQRKIKPPSKDNLRLFIRSNAVRPKSNSQVPWVVCEDAVKRYNIAGKLATVFVGLKTTPLTTGTKRKATTNVETEKSAKVFRVSATDQDVNSARKEDLVKKNLNDLISKTISGVISNQTSSESLGTGTTKHQNGTSVYWQNSKTVVAPVADDEIEFLGSVPGHSSPPPQSNNRPEDIPNLSMFNIPRNNQLFHMNQNQLLSQLIAAQAAGMPHILNTPNVPQPMLATGSPLCFNSPLQQSLPHSIFSVDNSVNSPYSSLNSSISSNQSPIQSPNSGYSMVFGKNIVVGPDGQLRKKRGRPLLTEMDKEKKLEFQRQMANVFINLGVTSSPNRQRSPSPPLNQPLKLLSQPQPPPPPIVRTPQKKTHTSETVMKLPIVRRLLFEHKNRKNGKGFARKVVYTMDHAVTRLNLQLITLITDPGLKDALMIRRDRMLEKRMMQDMTPENRECYIKKKNKELATKRRHEKQALNRKSEDQTLVNLLPLPIPAPVKTMGLPCSTFSDIAMIAEFLECFHEVFDLNISKNDMFTTTEIFEAVSSGKKGYPYISSLLCTMLPVVLYDAANTHYKELGIPLREMPINYQTAPELARLCLKHQKQDEILIEQTSEDGEEIEIGEEEDELSEDLLQKLANVELWDLRPVELVAFLTAITHRCMASDTLAAHVDRVEDMATRIYKERANLKKERIKDDIEMKQKKKEERKAKKKNKKPPGRPKGYSPRLGMTIADFYECKEQGKEVSPRKELFFQSRQKRKSTVERLEDDRKEQEVRDLEDAKVVRAERYKECENLLQKRRQSLRVTPMGTDRNHSRYWLFHNSTPGLYIEKGSLHDDIEYFVVAEDGTSAVTTPVKEESVKEIDDNSASEPEEIYTPSKGRPKAVSMMDMDAVNQTFPPLGDNVWYVYNTEQQIESLLKALSDKGIREHHLKHNLLNARGRISQSIAAAVSQDSNSTIKKVTLEIFKEESNETDETTKDLNVKLEDVAKTEVTEDVSIEVDDTACKQELKPEINSSEANTELEEEKASPDKAVESLKNKDIDCCAEMLYSLKDDICQIERELIEGVLGAVDHFDKWEKIILDTSSVDLLGDQLMEAQRCMQLKNLKGFMVPVRKQLPLMVPPPAPEGTAEQEAAVPLQPVQDYIELENTGVLKWREAVQSCLTLSRLHVLVGMFDSCIKWEKSLATKKCTVCRKDRQDRLILCEKCYKSWHLNCLRPKIIGDPPELWYCSTCVMLLQPRSRSCRGYPDTDEDRGRSKSRSNKTLYIEPPPPEPECKVCYGRLGLIFCSACTTPYHSECHEPPLLTRARKEWKCCECESDPDKLKPIRESPLVQSPRGSKDSPETIQARRQEVSDRRREQTASKPRSRTGQFLSKAVLAALAAKQAKLLAQQRSAAPPGTRAAHGSPERPRETENGHAQLAGRDAQNTEDEAHQNDDEGDGNHEEDGEEIYDYECEENDHGEEINDDDGEEIDDDEENDDDRGEINDDDGEENDDDDNDGVEINDDDGEEINDDDDGEEIHDDDSQEINDDDDDGDEINDDGEEINYDDGQEINYDDGQEINDDDGEEISDDDDDDDDDVDNDQ